MTVGLCVCAWVRVRVCVCVCERERESVCVCVCVCVRVWERERESVCVCVWERERVCVRVCERERESVCVLCVRRERECVCVCACVCVCVCVCVHVSLCVWLCCPFVFPWDNESWVSSFSISFFLSTHFIKKKNQFSETSLYGFCYSPQQATVEWQRVSQTVGGLPTDPTTKEPQLGMIGRVGESHGARSLALAHDVERLICELESAARGNDWRILLTASAWPWEPGMTT